MQLGKTQSLIVVKQVDFGVYLSEHQDSAERILLPKKQVSDTLSLHDTVEVFVYKDSDDRPIATTKKPAIELDEVALLKVVQVTKIGAFLDWGLEKDLFLPYREQLYKVKEGDQILVTMYIDKSQRLCASMRDLYHKLQTTSPYQKDDLVTGQVYEISENFGTFVAVDNRFSARIPKFEQQQPLKIGDHISAKVASVKPDGKLDLTLREKSYLQMDQDAKEVLALIESYGGVLPFNDKVSPEIILREAHMSKNAFKRAVGRLYKERKIEFTQKGIRLV